MAFGRPIDLDDAVESWRRTLGGGVRLRRDDADELCDHFRESVRMQIRAGIPCEAAVAATRAQFGSVEDVIEEMSHVHRPPSFFRRWCMLLVVFTVVQSTWVMLRIANAMMRVVGSAEMSLEIPGSIVFTIAAILAGGMLITAITIRFGLLQGGSVMRRAGNGFVPIAHIVGLSVVLFVGVVLIEYWEWWFVTLRLSGMPQPWGTVTTGLVVFVVAPILTLTAATLLTRWHPALETVDACWR